VTHVIVTARVKAFTHQPIDNYSCMVDQDGTVRVYDAIARHYTLCHALDSQTKDRIRFFARSAGDGTGYVPPRGSPETAHPFSVGDRVQWAPGVTTAHRDQHHFPLGTATVTGISGQPPGYAVAVTTVRWDGDRHSYDEPTDWLILADAPAQLQPTEPIVVVSQFVADAFGMNGMPNVRIRPGTAPTFEVTSGPYKGHRLAIKIDPTTNPPHGGGTQ